MITGILFPQFRGGILRDETDNVAKLVTLFIPEGRFLAFRLLFAVTVAIFWIDLDGAVKIRFQNKINGFIRLTRPVNVFIAMLSIALAAWLCGDIRLWAPVLLASLSGGVITAASNIINDYFDIEIDRVNKPYRPIPAGVVEPEEARVISLILYFTGVILGGLINVTAWMIAVGSAVLLYLYSARLKRTVLLGNLTVSLATGMAFIYGGVAVGNWRNALVPAVFAFFMHLGREIIKDMEDIEGDKRDNALTLPVKFGLFPAKVVTTLVFVALMVITVIPFVLKLYGLWYLIVVMAGVNTVLLFSIIMIWLRSGFKYYGFLSTLLKADMLVGLLAIYAGSWQV